MSGQVLTSGAQQVEITAGYRRLMQGILDQAIFDVKAGRKDHAFDAIAFLREEGPEWFTLLQVPVPLEPFNAWLDQHERKHKIIDGLVVGMQLYRDAIRQSIREARKA